MTRLLVLAIFCFTGYCYIPANNFLTDSLKCSTEFPKYRETSKFEYLVGYFPPYLIMNGIELKSYIRSESFKKLRTACGDLIAVDAIFIQGMYCSHNNVAVALLLSTIATMDRRFIPIESPLFNLIIPLSDESDEEFKERVSNLPAYFYTDTVSRRVNDRDKLQHFFASAFFTFILESPIAVNRLGLFVELFEDALVRGSAFDERDTRFNTFGQEFGLSLIRDDRVRPSQFLKGQIYRNQKYIGE